MKKPIIVRRKDGVKQRYWKGNIERETEKNKFFRKVLFTGDREQLVLMSIPVGGEIGAEIHHDVDQFFRVESGRAQFILEEGKETFTIGPGGAALVRKGTYHNVKTVGKKPLQLYTVYAPPNHPKGTIDHTRMDALLREARAQRRKE